MRKIFIILVAFLFFASLNINAQSVIHQESFESAPSGATVDYEVQTEFGGSDPNDYFQRITITGNGKDEIDSGVSGGAGTYMYAGEDIDGAAPTPKVITIKDISISGYSDITVTVAVGSGEQNKYDSGDYIEIYVKIDGGAETLIGAFYGYDHTNGDVTNGRMYEDENLDGSTSDDSNNMLSKTLADYTYSVTGVTSTVQVIIKLTTNSGDEVLMVDNVRINGVAAGSVANPSDFTASAGSTANDIDLSWTQNGAGDNVMVAYNTTNTFGTPSDGATYTAGETITGGGTVIYNGAGLSYNHSGLTSNTTYYYKAWSVDGTDTYSSGVETNALTAKEEPSNYPASFSAVANGSQEIDLSWTDASAGSGLDNEPDGYLIRANTTGTFSDPVDGTEEPDNTDSNGGVVNVSQGVGSYNWTGLSSNTQYYFKIWSYTNTGSHIDYLTTGTPPTANATTDAATPEYLFITEVADPGDVYQGRFVEIYNASSADIDFSSATWYLSRQSNGSPTSWADIQLTGSVPAGGFYVVAYSQSDFNTSYGFDPDQVNGSINGNGDDGYFLYKDGGHSTGTLVDAYGVINEDGTGKLWEYTNKHAERATGVTQANSTWSSSEWQITSANVADMTPYSWYTASDEQQFTTGLHDFNGQQTAVDILVNSSSNTSATLSVNRYAGIVANLSGVSEANTSYYSWVINTSDNTMTFNIDLRFDLDEIQGNGVSNPATSTVYLYHRSTTGTGTFIKLGAMTYDAGTNELRYTGLTTLSEFIFSSDDEPLPVELKSFTANITELGVELNWETATEVDNYGFEIERASSRLVGTTPRQGEWATIGFVQGHGNSNSPKSYSFVDDEAISGTVVRSFTG
ncbi:MAG: lamin tail domain-containing protein [Chlorobi bacterium]|nr:lamin tail domain-containing protein [Chlorobiota bacterium]